MMKLTPHTSSASTDFYEVIKQSRHLSPYDFLSDQLFLEFLHRTKELLRKENIRTLHRIWENLDFLRIFHPSTSGPEISIL